MTSNTRFVPALSFLLAACTPTVEETPGEETSPCNDGLCLEGLMCLSDVCVDSSEPTGTSGPTTGTDPDPMTGGPTSDAETGTPIPEFSGEVDVLFVVDNSGSMGEEQAALSQATGTFLDPLLAAGLSVRVAVTTSDDSNYWCRGVNISEPESGQFVSSSCLSRLSDFYFAGDDTNAETACTDFCALDNIEFGPTSIADDTSVASRPWLQLGSEEDNLPSGVSAHEALQCMLPQGINGCGFESTLESAWKALQLTGNSGQDEFGFMRDAAHLAVIFISDEADCSANPEHQNTVFGEEGVGNQQFWSLPDVQQSPSSAVCWNAGVSCDFLLAADQCTSVDLDVDGNPTSSEDEAALRPLARFRGQLENIRAEKQALGADVFAFGILGVPENYPQTGSLTYAEGPNGNDPTSFQARFGIGQGCASTVSEAVPPVRMRELVEASGFGSLYSVCMSDYTPALSGIANTIVAGSP